MSIRIDGDIHESLMRLKDIRKKKNISDLLREMLRLSYPSSVLPRVEQAQQEVDNLAAELDKYVEQKLEGE